MDLTNYPNGPSPVTKELILGISNGVGSSMHNFVTPGELKTGYLTGNASHFRESKGYSQSHDGWQQNRYAISATPNLKRPLSRSAYK